MADQSQYAETSALLAVMQDDEEAANTILRDFYPNELRDLADHLYSLNALVNRQLALRDARTGAR